MRSLSLKGKLCYLNYLKICFLNNSKESITYSWLIGESEESIVAMKRVMIVERRDSIIDMF